VERKTGKRHREVSAEQATAPTGRPVESSIASKTAVMASL
jgi:hypothetical protein